MQNCPPGLPATTSKEQVLNQSQSTRSERHPHSVSGVRGRARERARVAGWQQHPPTRFPTNAHPHSASDTRQRTMHNNSRTGAHHQRGVEFNHCSTSCSSGIQEQKIRSFFPIVELHGVFVERRRLPAARWFLVSGRSESAPRAFVFSSRF